MSEQVEASVVQTEEQLYRVYTTEQLFFSQKNVTHMAKDMSRRAAATTEHTEIMSSVFYLIIFFKSFSNLGGVYILKLKNVRMVG